MTPDPALLYMTTQHREVLAGLRYAVLAAKGFTLLTGDAGTGKTTVILSLMASLPPRVHPVLVVNPVLAPDEFLEYVMLRFGITSVPESKAQRICLLESHLRQRLLEGITPLLIIDEAHKMTPEVLEEIRLLGNIETPLRKLLQIILAGQTELCALLNGDSMRQLKQRIAVRLTLPTLSPAEAAMYITYRWSMCGGGSAPPFSAGAVESIARHAKGIPRVINAICDNALVLMIADGRTVIDEAAIRTVCSDLDLHDALAPAPAVRTVDATATNSATPGALPRPEPVESPEVTPFRTLRRYEQSGKVSVLMRCAARLGFGRSAV